MSFNPPSFIKLLTVQQFYLQQLRVEFCQNLIRNMKVLVETFQVLSNM